MLSTLVTSRFKGSNKNGSCFFKIFCKKLAKKLHFQGVLLQILGLLWIFGTLICLFIWHFRFRLKLHIYVMLYIFICICVIACMCVCICYFQLLTHYICRVFGSIGEGFFFFWVANKKKIQSYQTLLHIFLTIMKILYFKIHITKDRFF